MPSVIGDVIVVAVLAVVVALDIRFLRREHKTGGCCSGCSGGCGGCSDCGGSCECCHSK